MVTAAIGFLAAITRARWLRKRALLACLTKARTVVPLLLEGPRVLMLYGCHLMWSAGRAWGDYGMLRCMTESGQASSKGFWAFFPLCASALMWLAATPGPNSKSY